MEKLQEKFNIADKEGNKLEYDDGKILLHCSGELRQVGKIKENSNGNLTLYKELNSKKHIFRKNNSVGLCYELLRLLSGNDSVWIRVDKKTIYNTTIENFKQKGSFLHFKKAGFEKQMFLQLAYWNRYN